MDLDCTPLSEYISCYFRADVFWVIFVVLMQAHHFILKELQDGYTWICWLSFPDLCFAKLCCTLRGLA